MQIKGARADGARPRARARASARRASSETPALTWGTMAAQSPAVMAVVAALTKVYPVEAAKLLKRTRLTYTEIGHTKGMPCTKAEMRDGLLCDTRIPYEPPVDFACLCFVDEVGDNADQPGAKGAPLRVRAVTKLNLDVQLVSVRVPLLSAAVLTQAPAVLQQRQPGWRAMEHPAGGEAGAAAGGGSGGWRRRGRGLPAAARRTAAAEEGAKG